MKLRYYLRGLGIGITVTALIMGIALGGKKETMTDDEVKARALELGMIENTVLTATDTEPVDENVPVVDASENPEEDEAVPEETVVPELEETQITADATLAPTQEPEETAEPEETKEPEETPEPTAEPTATPTNAPAATATPTATPAQGDAAPDATVTIVINSGESSVTVSRKVMEAGLVESANEFDQYLCANGYDKRLTIGNHVISENATYEEIAQALTGR